MVAVRIKGRVVQEMEEVVGGKVVELVTAPEVRSTTRLIEGGEISKDRCKVVIINKLMQRHIQGGSDTDNIKKAKEKAKAERVIVIVLDALLSFLP